MLRRSQLKCRPKPVRELAMVAVGLLVAVFLFYCTGKLCKSAQSLELLSCRCPPRNHDVDGEEFSEYLRGQLCGLVGGLRGGVTTWQEQRLGNL